MQDVLTIECDEDVQYEEMMIARRILTNNCKDAAGKTFKLKAGVIKDKNLVFLFDHLGKTFSVIEVI